MNLIQKAVAKGGKLAPLIVGHDPATGTGLMNPSICVDADGDILVNLRKVNYTLYHSENKQKFPCPFGPLSYLHPEKDQNLRTTNYVLRLDKNLKIINQTEVQMLSIHAPIWTFVGLEDARLVQWEDKYYLMGVRRDTTPNGQGRMEYSQIEIDKENWEVKEVKRVRMPAPGEDNTYCEKNWMPVLDNPYHFVKWTMPTEIVWSNPETPETKTVILNQTPKPPRDQRGGTPIVKWGDYYICITHEVWLWYNYLKQKDSVYRHRLVVWDKDFNFLGLSPENISFLEAPIEFCIGAAIHKGDLLLGFGVQDNCAFVLRTPADLVDELIKEAIEAYTPEFFADKNVYEVPNYAKFTVYKTDLISDTIRHGQKWEPFLHDVFEQYITKDSVVLEGGANIGSHTVRLAQLANKVIAFEPFANSLAFLVSNLKLNNLNNVQIESKGLSDEEGTASFAYITKDNIGGAVLGNPNKDKTKVSLVTIDSLNLERLDFIKLDIEGYEKKAIIGGLETIKRCRPIITLECWENYPNATLEHATETFKFLLDLGYVIKQVEHHDFLFIPEEKND
jgi:FkbM family methyltransferase